MPELRADSSRRPSRSRTVAQHLGAENRLCPPSSLDEPGRTGILYGSVESIPGATDQDQYNQAHALLTVIAAVDRVCGNHHAEKLLAGVLASAAI